MQELSILLVILAIWLFSILQFLRQPPPSSSLLSLGSFDFISILLLNYQLPKVLVILAVWLFSILQFLRQPPNSFPSLQLGIIVVIWKLWFSFNPQLVPSLVILSLLNIPLFLIWRKIIFILLDRLSSMMTHHCYHPNLFLIFLEYSTIFVTRWEEDHSMYGKSVLELSLKCIFGDQKNFKNTSFFMMWFPQIAKNCLLCEDSFSSQ